MKTATSPPAAEWPRVVPENLCTLKQEQLAEQWQRLFGADPPDRLRRPLMIQALAYRLQERVSGGLKAGTRRLLAEAAGVCQLSAKHPTRRLKVGTVLIREWHGKKHQVTAVKDGFMFSGRHFKSLSKLAREITGTRWSGPLFFGLRNSRQEQKDGAH
jgi:Protein of unknown function (DUF2924)